MSACERCQKTQKGIGSARWKGGNVIECHRMQIDINGLTLVISVC